MEVNLSDIRDKGDMGQGEVERCAYKAGCASLVMVACCLVFKLGGSELDICIT